MIRKIFAFVVIFAIVMPWVHPTKIWADDGTKDGGRRTISTNGSSFAIDENGNLWAWGENINGQLGDDTTSERHQPVMVMEDIVTVTANPTFTLAINSRFELYAWGDHVLVPRDLRGRERRMPMQIMEGVHSVSVGLTHMVAIGLDGNLYAAGLNDRGQLGDGTTMDSNRFIPVMEGVIAASTGENHTMAVRVDGTLWAWGANDDGLLGDGTTEDRHEPVQIMQGVLTVSTNASHTMIILADGSLWGWGANDRGQIGDGSATASRIPIHIMDDVISVSVGGGGRNHGRTMAVKSDGSLWGWGDNREGRLGAGLIGDQHEPVHIMDNVTFVRTGDTHTSMAIDTDGDLWAWGANGRGQVGDGTTNNRILPTVVKSGVMNPVPLGMIAGELGEVEGDDSQTGNGLLIIGVAIVVLTSILIALLVVFFKGRKKGKEHSSDFDDEQTVREAPSIRYENRSNIPAYSDQNQTEIITSMNAPISGSNKMDATELISSPTATGNMNPYSTGNIQPIQGMSHTGPLNGQAQYTDPMHARPLTGPPNGQATDPMQTRPLTSPPNGQASYTDPMQPRLQTGSLNVQTPYTDPMQARVHTNPLNGQAPYTNPMQSRAHTGQMPHVGPQKSSGEFDQSVIAGSYTIEREVGGGAMSRTFVVKSNKLGTLWFLKFVSNQYGQLASEENILKLLNHVCLPKIIDVFHRPEGVYLIQTLVEGIPLDKFREINMQLSEKVLLGWTEQIAKTLNYLHNIRPTPVYHLDLKPGNIIVTHDNMLVLVDFGISRRFGEDQSGAIAVTAAYAAPEQFGGLIPVKYAQSIGERFGLLPPEAINWRIDARTDVYSLGVIMFELATGQGPTQKNLATIKNYVSNEFSYVIIKCMAVSPSSRYNSVMEVLEDVRRIKGG